MKTKPPSKPSKPASKPLSRPNAPAGRLPARTSPRRSEPDADPDFDTAIDLPDGGEAIASPVSGSIWKIAGAAGGAVKAGDVLVIVESMKMEIAISAPADGTLIEIRCAEGQAVSLDKPWPSSSPRRPDLKTQDTIAIDKRGASFMRTLFKRAIIGLTLTLAMIALQPPAMAADKTAFRIAWSIYVGLDALGLRGRQRHHEEVGRQVRHHGRGRADQRLRRIHQPVHRRQPSTAAS